MDNVSNYKTLGSNKLNSGSKGGLAKEQIETGEKADQAVYKISL